MSETREGEKRNPFCDIPDCPCQSGPPIDRCDECQAAVPYHAATCARATRRQEAGTATVHLSPAPAAGAGEARCALQSIARAVSVDPHAESECIADGVIAEIVHLRAALAASREEVEQATAARDAINARFVELGSRVDWTHDKTRAVLTLSLMVAEVVALYASGDVAATIGLRVATDLRRAVDKARAARGAAQGEG